MERVTPRCYVENIYSRIPVAQLQAEGYESRARIQPEPGLPCK